MKEINEAYDTVMNERKARANNGGYQQQNSYGGYPGGGYQPGASYGRSTEYGDVRNLLMNGRIADAEQILDGVPSGRRGAEWYFLKGTCLYKKGWMEEAYNNFSTACNMDPGNMEYRAAMNQCQNQRNGAYACDMCSSLICADCCCECMGGDLIPCC